MIKPVIMMPRHCRPIPHILWSTYLALIAVLGMVHNLPLIVVNCHGYKTLLAVISHQFWLVVLDIFLLSVFAMVD